MATIQELREKIDRIVKWQSDPQEFPLTGTGWAGAFPTERKRMVDYADNLWGLIGFLMEQDALDKTPAAYKYREWAWGEPPWRTIAEYAGRVEILFELVEKATGYEETSEATRIFRELDDHAAALWMIWQTLGDIDRMLDEEYSAIG